MVVLCEEEDRTAERRREERRRERSVRRERENKFTINRSRTKKKENDASHRRTGRVYLAFKKHIRFPRNIGLLESAERCLNI